MKKRSIALTLIFALLLAMFSTVAVLAEEDDHGADAHSDSMSNMEDMEYDGEVLSFQEEILNAVTTYAPYVIGLIVGVIVLVIIVKAIKRNKKPKYTGKH